MVESAASQRAMEHSLIFEIFQYWLAFHMLIIKIVAVVKEGFSLNKKIL